MMYSEDKFMTQINLTKVMFTMFYSERMLAKKRLGLMAIKH